MNQNEHSEKPAAIAAPVTILTNAYGYLTKRFMMDGIRLVKQSAAQLVRGMFAVHHVSNLSELDSLLKGLESNQAVTYGRPEQDDGQIITKDAKDAPADGIARTRENFSFGATQGIMMLDYDPPKGGIVVEANELIALVRKAMPELDGVAMLWRASSSSGVNGTGLQGQRIYIMVSDASQIPHIGQILFDRLWLAGHGYYKVSASGQTLERALVDDAVWQPERMDFAASPVLDAGVTRNDYDSMIIEGCIFEVSEAKALTTAEKTRLAEIKQNAREAIQPEVQVAKQSFMVKMKTEMPERLKALQIEAGEEAIGVMVERATMQNILMGNWPLTTHDGKTVTVGTVLDNPVKYHNTRFADPLEPGSDKRVAWANLRSGGRPYIYSHQNHGVCFWLERAPAVVFVNNAELPRMVDLAAEIIQKAGEMYEHAGSMVYVNEYNKITPAKQPWLQVAIQRLCRFEEMNKKEELVATRCPVAVVNGLLADGAKVRMDKLTAVRNAPTIDCDGRQLFTPGYDAKTGLLLVNDQLGPWPAISKAPSHKDLILAFAQLWMPFKQFPYATDADKSVALAAVLTAAVRSTLPTSPGFGFSATAPGTGKTLLAQCIGTLYEGAPPAITPPHPTEDSWSKALFSAALGGASTLLFDNAEYPIESASLCAVTTAPAIKNRVLGDSRDAEAVHRMLILATGNGLQFVGDLNRRFFVCRLDANMEAGAIVAREFDINPLKHCQDNRLKMISAALMLIQGYIRAGAPRVCDGLASMDDWNKLVRSTIVWLIQQDVLHGFVDPKQALARDSANDPDKAMLTGLLATAKDLYGTGKFFTVSELVRKGKACANDLFMDIAGERGEVSTKKLGQWMKQREGRIVNGLRIARGKDNRFNTATWEVQAA